MGQTQIPLELINNAKRQLHAPCEHQELHKPVDCILPAGAVDGELLLVEGEDQRGECKLQGKSGTGLKDSEDRRIFLGEVEGGHR